MGCQIRNKSLVIIFFILSLLLFSQEGDRIAFKNGIDKPSILSTHHFGIFSSRISQNFKIQPSQQNELSINYTSGNNFHPYVEAYLPIDPQVRDVLSNQAWYARDFTFIDQETTPADYFNIEIDAVIKEFRLNYSMSIAKQHEFNIGLRSYLITKGKYPFSFFTSDESIEWFHSNIAGGEDAFGRRFYGLNKVNFKYTDRNGRTLELKQNDFFIGGLEINYFYYPNFLRNELKQIYVNIGSHLGINTSKYNPTIDFGLSLNAIKKVVLRNRNEFNFGFGASVLRKNIMSYKADAMDLGNNTNLGFFEADIEFTKYTKKKNYHALSINYQMQSRFNKKSEKEYYKLTGLWREVNAGWQNGATTLYANLTSWNLIYTYGRFDYKISLYLKEDLLVNNAPDVQTGIQLVLPFF